MTPIQTSGPQAMTDPGPRELGRARVPLQAPASTLERVRKVTSFLPYSGLVPPPSVFRPFGVSAMIIAKNEADWVETSIRSLLGRVDELVTADHGSEDGTGEIMRDLCAAYPTQIRHVPIGGHVLFHDALNHLISQCRYRWVLRFSADFVARTSGTSSIDSLLAYARALDPRRYFCIRLSGVALQGDLQHQFPRRRDRAEHLLYTYSPWLRYRAEKQWESLHVPAFYEKLAPDPAFYFHMETVKPAVRVTQKLYWHRWFEARTAGSSVSLRDFASARAMKEWGGRNFEEAAQNFIVQEFQGCVPFSRELCGDYPDILKPALDDPPFKLIFDNGKVVDRLERARFRPGKRLVGETYG